MRNIEPLKSFVKEECGNSPILQEIILQEPDRLEDQEFLTKCTMWLRIMAAEKKLLELHGAGRPQNRLVVRQ
jgi:hypothetical protein